MIGISPPGCHPHFPDAFLALILDVAWCLVLYLLQVYRAAEERPTHGPAGMEYIPSLHCRERRAPSPAFSCVLRRSIERHREPLFLMMS